MVQGIFDDLNPETRSRWAYPDTKLWDPERNTREFLAAMPLWRDHGLLAFTIAIPPPWHLHQRPNYSKALHPNH
jgi:hypothetical protein